MGWGGVGWGGVGWGGVGWGGVGSSFKVKRMIVVHSHPPSHIISNVNEWQNEGMPFD
jgi:hypothetical protein